MEGNTEFDAAAETPDEARSLSSEPNQPGPGSVPADAPASIRVLIVDDHAMVREWTRSCLAAAEGIEVAGLAENGAEALHLVSDVGPDVLILDVHLPDMSGIEVARRVRDTMPHVAIVVLTGYDDASYAQALLQIGVLGFMSKAASGAELVTAVRQAAAGQTTVRSDAARAAVGKDQTKLKPRERQILSLLVAGQSNLSIADALQLSVNIVEHNVSQLLLALNARSRAEVIQKAYEAGIVPPSTTFLRGQPAVPMLKIYHGYRDRVKGTFVVQVQEGELLRLLVHDCEARELAGCHSPQGWQHGIGGYGGLELARWLLADCLGAEFLDRATALPALLPAFKSSFLTGLDPVEWAIAEASIRTWANEHRLHVGTLAKDKPTNPFVRIVSAASLDR